ncbi:PAC2 family protein [Candidatus Woesearchaeota archaeon]|nr:PAC2 family protein [Candidatus Woesearchaeota archaeon]MCF7901190.1 PAC2 family protein [Candidatus Woesearchaeota archaeon]MCF8013715.1 PAC2 family protein [Candidatus Woesearchaeota archaeon]
MWKITTYKKVDLKNPVFIEGLPGIANVGKIVADYLIEELDAELFMTFFSDELPNSVFVNEDNLVELPKIELYYKNVDGKDFLFLAGDVQPSNEKGSYSFSNLILDILEKANCKQIITLGGIGLQEIPESPKVYCTGNSKNIMNEFKELGAKTDIYGLVGPIIGVSGLLVGLAKKRKIPGIALLAETYGHPIYLGLKGAKQTLKILKKKFLFEFSYRSLNKEIKLMDRELQGEDIKDKSPKIERLRKIKETNYIG